MDSGSSLRCGRNDDVSASLAFFRSLLMQLMDPRPAIDRDVVGRIGIEIVGQRVELFLPMSDAVPRPSRGASHLRVPRRPPPVGLPAPRRPPPLLPVRRPPIFSFLLCFFAV